jgi:hypothetical protein
MLILWGCAIAIAAIWVILGSHPPRVGSGRASVALDELLVDPDPQSWWTARWLASLMDAVAQISPVTVFSDRWSAYPVRARPRYCDRGECRLWAHGVAHRDLRQWGGICFSPQIGLLAVGLTLLMPRLIKLSLDFQLDYAADRSSHAEFLGA